MPYESGTVVSRPVWIIYCHTHAPSGRRYVGQTKLKMEARWAQHVRSMRTSPTGGSRFTQAIRAFGPETFTHEVLAVVTMAYANKAEKMWIKKLGTLWPNGFNEQTGG